MKSLQNLNKQELKNLICDLVRDGAEVQGMGMDDFIKDGYNIKLETNDKDYTSDGIARKIQDITREFLPDFECVDMDCVGTEKYVLMYIDHETEHTFAITFSLLEDIAILSDIIGSEPKILETDTILKKVVLPKINTLFY